MSEPTSRRALLVIAKRPVAGQTKTRLSPPLSPEQAADLYECFLLDTLDLARAVPDVTRMVLFLPLDADGYFADLAPDFQLLPQVGASLGERLDNALTDRLEHGFGKVIVMDSDSPTLPVDFLRRAFDLLDESEAVFGPTDDGGYYLVGVTCPQPHLLRGVQMSTPRVLSDTLALAEQHGTRVSLLPSWHDVDTSADLRRLESELSNGAGGVAPHTWRWLRDRSHS